MYEVLICSQGEGLAVGPEICKSDSGALAMHLDPISLGGGRLSQCGEPVWVWVWGLAAA